MSEHQGRKSGVEESKKRGLAAGGAAVATVAAATLGAVPLAIVGAGATGALTLRWWKHRSKNGIRF